MRIYVAGPVADTVTVQQVQDAVVAAGHELTLDWSADVSLAECFASQIERSARMAEEELRAVIAADAVLVVASQHDGRGMFVELGAALARATRGDLDPGATGMPPRARGPCWTRRSRSSVCPPWAMHHWRIVEATVYIYREGRLRDESVGFDLHQ